MTAYLHPQPYIVLDQNRCRDQNTIEAVLRRCNLEGLAIFLPDTAALRRDEDTSVTVDPTLTAPGT